MNFKKLLLKIYYLPNLSKPKIDLNQQKIRDIEWESIKKFITPSSKFLDVGCGAGYAMIKAEAELKCICFGVDADPGAHGVGRYDNNNCSDLNIVQGFAEDLPYNNQEFDVVYSSHVLEHVNDEQRSLQEMKRVLKPDGVLIIGMPTASMAWINFITQLLFTTHHRVINVFLRLLPFINAGKTPLINMLVPPSHSSHRAKTVLYDLKYYRINNWKRIVQQEFRIEQILLPALYPYPEYRQLFKLRKNGKHSSSVFFICKKDQ
jgi:ubiquinone/menaquinone biosynthesis C-methylase UbiE